VLHLEGARPPPAPSRPLRLTRAPPLCARALAPRPAPAVVTLALLGAFDEADWLRKLPQLADRLADMGPSHWARIKARGRPCVSS
jgi:hypothetical protein